MSEEVMNKKFIDATNVGKGVIIVTETAVETSKKRFSLKWSKGWNNNCANSEKFAGIAWYEAFGINIDDSEDILDVDTDFQVWRLNEQNSVTGNKYVRELAASQGKVIVVDHDVLLVDFPVDAKLQATLDKINA